MSRPIKVVKLGRASGGYKILTSWKRPGAKVFDRKVDLWIPELSPKFSLAKRYLRGRISWGELERLYALQLRSAAAQDYLKPLALISLRKKLVLLCDCARMMKCPGRVLARAIVECRDKKDFVIGEGGGHEHH